MKLRKQVDLLVSALERIGDRRMWSENACGLTWEGETPDGNEIETDDPRDIAHDALVAVGRREQ